eukprot:9538069-Lingulodinium_polyedra.AAC.1
MDLVSLPDGGGKPVPLAELPGREGQRVARDFTENHVLPKWRAEENRAAAAFARPYSDPGLKGAA